MPSQNLLVVQPLPGIGDMIWHLPPIRALARHAGAPVTLLAKPRSRADELFAAEDTLREIIWVDRNPKGGAGEHDGLHGLGRLIRTLRARRFDAVVLLHNSASLAFATWAAGIPVRQGYGIGAQRWFLNRGPRLPWEAWQGKRPLVRATAFLQAANIPMPDSEPRLTVTPAASAVVRQRLATMPRPFLAVGIGSSEPARQWGAPRLIALARTLLDAGWPSLLLVGGAAEAALAQEIRAACGNDAGRVLPVLGWHLGETAALLAEAAFYVGNDTGAMNLAAAIGTRAYALFGTTPPLRHSPLIIPVVSPPGGPNDGVARVSLQALLAVIQADRGRLSPISEAAAR